MTRRISSSRPMTGSSLPWRAASVRSRPYFSSAWYCSSGFCEVTRWLPRTSRSAAEQLVVLDPDQVGQGQQQVLDRQVLVAQVGAHASAGSSRSRASRAKRDVGCRRRPWGSVAEPLRHPVGERGGRHPHPGQHGQGEAVGLAQQGGQQVVGGDLGVVLRAWPRSAAACSASWVLSVQRLGSSATALTSCSSGAESVALAGGADTSAWRRGTRSRRYCRWVRSIVPRRASSRDGARARPAGAPPRPRARAPGARPPG